MTHSTPLRAVLEAEGRKQIWLAAKVGIDPADLSRIVKGMPTSAATQDAIAAALGRPVSELFHVAREATPDAPSDGLERSAA